MKRVHKKASCLHCGETKRIKARGLCEACYKRHRNEYAVETNFHVHDGGEPTQEQVDRMVEEGYRNLPRWWNSQQGVKCDD